MADTGIGPISPELVLVSPELRAALMSEFEREMREAAAPQPAPAEPLSPEVYADASLSSEATQDAGGSSWPQLLAGAAAYGMQRVVVLVAQTAAVAFAGVVTILILGHL